jgi:hypothetical protein
LEQKYAEFPQKGMSSLILSSLLAGDAIAIRA